MSDQPLLPRPVPSLLPANRAIRVEYLDFQNVGDYREFRLRVCGPDESTEFRLRIAFSAFGAGRVRLQDGPDVCYQKLLKIVAAGETPGSNLLTLDEADLTSYREAHTPVAKHRTWTPSAAPATSTTAPPRKPMRAPSPPPRPVEPPVTNDTGPSALQEGQRVRHAVYGVGVTTSSNRGHTVVRFDQDGPKRFITSLLEVDVLSAPHTWETGPRGINRPSRTPAEG